MKEPSIQLGLWQNRRQFFLLVLVNGFVGGLLGLERTLLPLLAAERFEYDNFQKILSFIVVFGMAKAVTNYLSGPLAERFGRKQVLVAGWWIGLPVPFLLWWSPSWNLILLANGLLGIMQGLTWSSTVVMKMDLVGNRQQGLAMGLNESAGYLSVAGMAWLTAQLTQSTLYTNTPFGIGILIAVLGLVFSRFLIRDTGRHVQVESRQDDRPRLKRPFLDTSFNIPSLRAITQAGFVNNLNDGMMWGLMPILLIGKGLSLSVVGLIVALYPAVWGLGQLVTGKLSDLYCKKNLLWLGMLMQALAILLFTQADQAAAFAFLSVLLGLGTALVYPTFLAAIAAHTHPRDRAQSLGTFRFWRDLGYAVGAMLTGWLADQWNIPTAIGVIGWITLVSAYLIYRDMTCASNQTSSPENKVACLSSQA